jgi:hypothetical protein
MDLKLENCPYDKWPYLYFLKKNLIRLSNVWLKYEVCFIPTIPSYFHLVMSHERKIVGIMKHNKEVLQKTFKKRSFITRTSHVSGIKI